MSKPERHLFVGISALCALVSLLDLLGVLSEVLWLRERIPTITLLLISLALPTGLKILNEIAKSDLDQFEALLRNLIGILDPDVKSIFGDYFEVRASKLRHLLKYKELELHDLERFRMYYERTLAQIKIKGLVATGLPSREFFWTNDRIESAIRDVATTSGYRFVFILKSLDQLQEAEVREVIQESEAFGVQAFVAVQPEPELSKLFVADIGGRFAWEATKMDESRIASCRITFDVEKVETYLQDFQRLMKRHEVKPYREFLECQNVKWTEEAAEPSA